MGTEMMIMRRRRPSAFNVGGLPAISLFSPLALSLVLSGLEPVFECGGRTGTDDSGAEGWQKVT